MTLDAIEHDCGTREALRDLVAIIDAAGLHNLSNGVQLGRTSWYVKAGDRMAYARRFIGSGEGQ